MNGINMKLNFETGIQILFILISAVLIFALFTHGLRTQTTFILVITFALFYLISGVAYHGSKGDLNKGVLLEYASLALLVSLVGLFLTRT